MEKKISHLMVKRSISMQISEVLEISAMFWRMMQAVSDFSEVNSCI